MNIPRLAKIITSGCLTCEKFEELLELFLDVILGLKTAMLANSLDQPLVTLKITWPTL